MQKRYIVLTAAVVLLAIAAAAYAAWPMFGPAIVSSIAGRIGIGAAPPEHSARYYPADTIAYSWLTLNPGGGQKSHFEQIYSLAMDRRAFRDWQDEIEDLIERQFGIEIDGGSLDWLGAEISFGLIDFDIEDETVEFATTIDVRDREGALDILLAYMDDASGAEYRASDFAGFEIWDADESDAVFGLSDDLLIIASEYRVVREMARRIRDNSDNTLAQEPNFAAARAEMRPTRLASAYLNAEAAANNIERTFRNDPAIAPFFDAADLPEWAALSAGLVERGIVFEQVTPNAAADADSSANSQDVMRLANLLPPDTVAAMLLAFDPDVDNWRKTLRQYDMSGLYLTDAAYMLDALMYEMDPDSLGGMVDPENLHLGQALDALIIGVEVLTGVHLEFDLIDHLNGELALAVSEFELNDALELYEPVDAALLLGYHDEEPLAETLGVLTDRWLELQYYDPSVDYDQIEVNGSPATVLLSDMFANYNPTYGLYDGYLVAATTTDMMADTTERIAGDGGSLADGDEYRRALQHAGGGSGFALYIDMHRLSWLLEDTFYGGLSDGQHHAISDALGSLLVVDASTPAHTRIRAVLTLFPGAE